jgi:hypothetical protein
MKSETRAAHELERYVMHKRRHGEDNGCDSVVGFRDPL